MARKGKQKAESKASQVQPGETVSEEASEEAKPTARAAHLERLASISEIAKQNQEDRDNPVSADDEVAAAEREMQEGEQEHKAEQPVDEATPEQQETEPEKKTESGEQSPKRKFIIDGKDTELSDEEITRLVQISGTAESRLAEATQLLANAKQAVKPAATPKESQARTQPPASSPSSEAGAGEQRTDIVAAAKAIQYGTEEEVVQSLEKLFGRERQQGDAALAATMAGRAPGMSQDELMAMVQGAIAFESARQLLETAQEHGGFNDVWMDPVLRNEFMRRENQYRDQGDTRSHRELYGAIAKEVRQWRDEFVKKYIPPTGLESRDQLKSQTGVVRGAGGRPTAPVQERPMTDEERTQRGIQQIARARGQKF